MTAARPDPPPKDLTTLRQKAINRLWRRQQQQQLTTTDLKAVSEVFDVTTRTVRRWIDNASRHDGIYTPKARTHFTLTTPMHDSLARWCGNAAAAYRELHRENELGNPPTSPATFHRAVQRELTPGQRTALRLGEKGRRNHDVHRQRPQGFRNEAWETDHVEASVWINIDGQRHKPSITWFIDHATCAITGAAITPHQPSTDAILAAIRDAVLTGGHHRPFGGIPKTVRIDRGRDFLSKAVDTALKALGTHITVLPPRTPHRKGTVEALNAAVKHTLFKGMPGYTEAPTSIRDKHGRNPWKLDDLVDYETFITLVLNWIDWWNNDHTIARLHRRTPAQAWTDDLTPIETLDPETLHTYTLQRSGPPLTITSKGIRFNNSYYIADWMHGHAGAGEQVHLRHQPHHYHRVELYDAHTGTYRGPAFRSDEMTDTEARNLDTSRRREANHYATKLTHARRNTRTRYAATSTPTTPQRLNRLSAPQAASEIRTHETRQPDTTTEARPDLLPRPRPTAGHWTTPLPDTPPTPEDT
ncbi:Mu transposase C-terminal domain-containing protein [Streptomyces sp. NPDC056460]|uniref:Mu transposase C-terminal domain-containing protein n=1 Tax=Streptomyces sp. NPDC056460 TaxID=3345825 RepID=UPI00368F1F92